MSQTKRVTHSSQFTNASAVTPDDSLAYMLMQVFGVSLDSMIAAINKMIASKDEAVVILCADAAAQIRGNAVYVGTAYAGVRTKFPEFIIDSQRDVGDQFNFSALHVAGHAILDASKTTLGSKILSKVGNCITGSAFPSNAAGKINAELKASWSPDELSNYNAWINELTPEPRAFLASVINGIPARAARFGAALAGSASASAPVARVPKAVPAKKPAEAE